MESRGEVVRGGAGEGASFSRDWRPVSSDWGITIIWGGILGVSGFFFSLLSCPLLSPPEYLLSRPGAWPPLKPRTV
jgi:hypothetical protein